MPLFFKNDLVVDFKSKEIPNIKLDENIRSVSIQKAGVFLKMSEVKEEHKQFLEKDSENKVAISWDHISDVA